MPKLKECQHKHLYVWAEEGAEYGRCYACGEVILQRVTDAEVKGLYPLKKYYSRGRKRFGNLNLGVEGAIKKIEG